MDDRVSVSTEADTHDEAATRAASSHGPASALPSDTPPEGEKQESQRSAQDSVDDSERGADQDPDAAPAPAAAADVAVDLDALTEKADKADEYLQLAQRTKADFENYRKRAARDAADAQERGVVKLVRELLPAVDNLDRALEAVIANGEPSEELISGIKLVHAEVIAALNRAGVERFDPEGERFDPERHEAVAQQPVEGAEPGTVVDVYQRGYRLGDAVIRPARVVVAG